MNRNICHVLETYSINVQRREKLCWKYIQLKKVLRMGKSLKIDYKEHHESKQLLHRTVLNAYWSICDKKQQGQFLSINLNQLWKIGIIELLVISHSTKFKKKN